MADVLLARTDGIEGFERHVVLKRIKSENAKDGRFIKMFLDEARVAAGLHHQNIVQVYDIGEDKGEYFFAMEYIHGEDLRKLLSAVSKTKGHMPLGIVCAILSAAAAGLHYAHTKKGLNIVHRDVSPSNILIGYDGAVKVVDFGIAKAAMRQVETRSGSLKGKVSYMSPEQCKGENIDRRSDVYALGVLLYELATTSRLFKGDNDYLVMDAIVNGRVPLPRVRRPDLPNDLSSTIMRALSPEPSRRYQTADDLRVALDAFAERHNLNASTSALSSYMHKVFGERPEPWLEIAAPVPNVDVEGPTQAAHQSWSAMAGDTTAAAIGEEATQDQVDPATTTDRKRRSGIANAVAVADTIAPPISTRETRTSMKLGWEARSSQSGNRNKLFWASLPLLALLGAGIWMLGADDDPAPRPAAAPAPAAIAPTPAPAAVAPALSPVHEIPAVRVAGAEPAPVQEVPPVRGADGEDKKVAKTVKPKSGPAKPASAVAAAKPAVAATPPAPTPTPAVATVPPPAPTPPPAPPPEPKEVEVPMATLSNATVSAIASDHSQQLSQCEGSGSLKGDVAVMFQIDGTGRVVKSQLSSSIKNPKVASCILKAVQSWKFPKPPSGSAKGVYSISYQ
jgi:serine/threonine-protein kinase